MAPSYEIGNPQKSLVRIPGSGTDKDRKPICLEIAQITSFARSDTFPNILRTPPFARSDAFPNILRTPPVLPLLDNAGRVQRMQLPFRDMIPSGYSLTGANISTSNYGAISRKRNLDNETCSQAKKINVANDSENKISNAEDKTTIIKNLLRDKEKLEEQNEELRKKIIMFKDLLRNKAKLDEFLVSINQQQIVT